MLGLTLKILSILSKVSKGLNEVFFCIFAVTLAGIWGCYENYKYKITKSIQYYKAKLLYKLKLNAIQ